MALLHIDSVKENRSAFESKVRDISSRLGIDPNWIMHVMYLESGLNHRIQNTTYPVDGGYATGLIQFIPSTARSLGTTADKIRAMTNVQQLAPYRSKLQSFIDVYFTVFFPAAAGKPKEWVFQTAKISAHSVAASNPVFDLNKDGKLSVAEVEQAMMKKVPAALVDSFKKKVA